VIHWRISFPQFDWRSICGTLNTIYEWNFVLHHRSTKWINKKSKKVHTSMPYQSLRAIFYIVYNPSFKISTILNQLQNEGSFLWNHENLHQIYQNVVVLFFSIFLTNTQTTDQYLHVYDLWRCHPLYILGSIWGKRIFFNMLLK
jgi:hypothetical protein